MKKFVCLLVLAGACGVFAQTRPEMLLLPVETNSAQREVFWSTEPGIRYELLSSTNLVDWTTVDGFPTVAAALAQQHVLELQNASKGFFKVLVLDEQPPVITPESPVSGAFAVHRFSKVTIALSDASGIDPSSILLTVDGLGSYTLADSQLSFADGVLTFDNGGDTALGGYGANVQISVAASDINGNSTDYAWSFDLETESVVGANLFVFGSPAAQRAGQQVGAIATRVLAERMNGGPIRMSSADPWTLEEVSTNSITIAYTGDNPPYFSEGAYIVNLTPATWDEIFYRQITGTDNNAASKTLVLFTVDVPLTDIVTQGSVAMSDESVVFEIATNGAIVRAVSMVSATLQPVGYSLDGAVVKVDDDGWQVSCNGATFSCGAPPFGGWDGNNVNLELEAEECHFWLHPSLEACVDISNGLKRFYAVAKGDVESALVWRVNISNGVTYNKTVFDLPDSANPRVNGIYLGAIGIVPIWADVSLDMKIDLDIFSMAQLQCRYGFRKDFNAAFGLKYENSQFNWVNDFAEKPTQTISTASLSGEVGIGLTLRPTVIVMLSPGISGLSLAGIETGPAVRGGFRAEVKGEQLAGYLEGEADWNIAAVGSVFGLFDPKPSLSFDIWNPPPWKLFPLGGTLEFTKQPGSQTVLPGGTAVLECSVSASQPVSYQWYQNSAILNGRTGRTLSLSPVTSGHTGDYKVRVTAGGLSIESQIATVTVTDFFAADFDMVIIPAGSFSMGDHFEEGVTESPVHTVFVDSFYIDRYPITVELWDQVYFWAIENGYEFDSTRGSSPPVFGPTDAPAAPLSWNDAVAWCNARSEMEGLRPAYYYDSGLASVYRGEDPFYARISGNDHVDWQAGYRLPTEAEWEKAARGRLHGRRFPWGDTISHARANFNNIGGESYATGTTGMHPFYPGRMASVGLFAPNGYGLYDMVGSKLEFCWDRFAPYSYSMDSDNPKGPEEDMIYDRRIARGGAFSMPGFQCRVSARRPIPSFFGPRGLFGLRTVLPR